MVLDYTTNREVLSLAATGVPQSKQLIVAHSSKITLPTSVLISKARKTFGYLVEGLVAEMKDTVVKLMTILAIWNS